MSDANLERITILLQARDRDFARAMDRNNKLVAKLSRDATRNMQTMQRQVEGSFTRMGSAAAAFGTSFLRGLAVGAVTGAIAGITASMRGAVSTLSALGKAARDAGIDVEQLQGLQRGFARAARVTAEEVTQALVAFNTRVGQAMEGDGQFAAIAERYGIALRAPNGELRTQAELLQEVANRVRAAGSEAERAAIANAAFGQVGRRMAQAMTGGAEALDDMVTQARAAGDIMDRNLIHRMEILDDKFDALTRRVGNFFRELAGGAIGGAETPIDSLIRIFGSLERAQGILDAEVFQGIINQTNELEAASQAALATISQGIDSVADRAGILINALNASSISMRAMGETGAADAMRDAAVQIAALVDGVRAGTVSADEFQARLVAIAREANNVITELRGIDRAEFGLVSSELTNLSTILGGVYNRAIAARNAILGINAAAAPGLEQFEPLGEGGRVTPRVLEGSAIPAGTTRPRSAPAMLGEPAVPRAGRGGGGRGNRDGYAEAVRDIQERTRALEMEAAALLTVAASGIEYGNAVEFARTKAQLMNQAIAEGRQLTPELVAEIDRLAAAYVTAGQSAQDAARQMEEVRANTERGIDAMVDLFMAIGQGGDAARAAIARLIAELARMQMMRAFQTLAGGSSGGGFFGFLGSLLGGGRAAGGPVRAGQAYRVNENTPNSEIFVPSRSGGVLNVAQAKDAMRGQSGGAMAITVNVAGASGDQHIIDLVQQGVSIGLRQFDKALPDRMGQINRAPRFR
jgi:hypothetical protein